jgi:hypothetical protein
MPHVTIQAYTSGIASLSQTTDFRPYTKLIGYHFFFTIRVKREGLFLLFSLWFIEGKMDTIGLRVLWESLHYLKI